MEEKKNSKCDIKKEIHPHQRASIISRLFFCWTVPLFLKGLKKDLTENDLYPTLKSHKSKILGDLLEQAWNSENNNYTHPSLWRALSAVFGKEVAKFGLILLFLQLAIRMTQPLFVGKLMEYYKPNQTTITETQAYFYAACIVSMSLLNVLIVHSYMLGLQQLGMKIRVACCSLIYRKALKLSKGALTETTVGQLVNLLSNDVNRFDPAIIHLNVLWVAPLEALIIMYLLYASIGLTALVGVGLLFLFVPIQMYISKRISVYRLRTALKTDQRVRLMNEIISGIQVIKMYTWEKPFAKLVASARKMEIRQIRANAYLRAINLAALMFLNRTAIFFCVLTYVLTGNTLNFHYVYVLSPFYAVLRQGLTAFLPVGMSTFAETTVSVKRIQAFLRRQEVHQLNTNKSSTNPGIYMDGISVDYCLNNVSFTVNPRELVAVIGPVGSGKSTLLNVILQEVPVTKGQLEINGRISFASQEPWLFAASIRQNILFGERMDLEKYRKVLAVCALEIDLAKLPHGDLTVVGERGVMLSGGQKARISLARTVYKDADIYLLDDPLAAVDAHVGRQLFDECILGFLKEKTVVLVTHQLQYLSAVDRIDLVENGRIAASGSYAQLKQVGIEYMKMLEVEMHHQAEEVDESAKSFGEPNIKPVEFKEGRSTGAISNKVYRKYLKAGGNYCVSIIILVLFVLAQISASGTDYFLTFWVNLEQHRLEDDNTTYFSNIESFFIPQTCLYLYTILIMIVILMSFICVLSFSKFCMTASTNLHNTMFSKLVLTSMRFFNTNPSGRILNRFSKDMGAIDEILPNTMADAIQVLLMVLATVIITSVVNPWTLIPTVIMLTIFYCLKLVFLATSRNLKRIEGTTRSPVFTHLAASLHGMTTIRAFGVQDIVRVEFDKHQDLHSSTWFMFMSASRTFGFWLDITCVVYIGLVTFSFLFIGTEVYGGNVGLAITQSITLTGLLQFGMRQWSQFQNQTTSIERILEYTELPSEPDQATKRPAQSWPDCGKIEFKSVSLQYAPEEPIVLKNISFQIKPREKIGIVGRTGAGKSSIIYALFRLVAVKGSILIDGIDIKEVPLSVLRSRISIIPQEPVLFGGTLRRNLDPFDEFNDSQLWNALAEVELQAAVSQLPSGLQSVVVEGGSNFSVGQRQLLCLARAVIRRNTVLIIDEATANVDPQTDELIQTTIRKQFKDCTVLTIAHRLHTVMDSDRILVMDDGTVVEFDQPYQLLKNPTGFFHELVNQTGKGMADNLTKIAREFYEKTENITSELSLH